MLIGTFLLALLLAIPTFGISLVIWLVFAWAKVKVAGVANDYRDDGIERFKKWHFADGDGQKEFMRILAGKQEDYALAVLSEDEKLILNNIMIRYIITHSDVRERFEEIVSLYETLGAASPSSMNGAAVKAITFERDNTLIGGALYYICFKIIQTLITNNPNHALLGRVNLEEVGWEVDVLEQSMQHEREMGRALF